MEIDINRTDVVISRTDVSKIIESYRKHGEWKNGQRECPFCGEDKFKGLDADIWADWKPNYCPNCGADMRGDSK